MIFGYAWLLDDPKILKRKEKKRVNSLDSTPIHFVVLTKMNIKPVRERKREKDHQHFISRHHHHHNHYHQ